MSTWTARRLAWSIGVFSLVLMVGTLVLMFVDRKADLPKNVGSWTVASVFYVIVTIAVPILGIVIVNKQPKNTVGWLFIVSGIAIAVGTFGQAYALHALRGDPGSLPGGQALAWLRNVLWPIPNACLILVFLLFPTGHPESPRWRVVVVLTLVILAVLMVASLILATASWSDPFEGVDIEAGAWGDLARLAILLAVLEEIVVLLLSVVSIAIRYRRSSGQERLQLKWFVSAAAVTAVAFSVGFYSDSPVVSAIVYLSLLGLFVAIGIAMVKHNLYDIDVILNKAIAYGGLAAIITAIYVIVVVVIGALIGVTEGLSLVATAVVAVAFQPIRRRAQHFANRLVYGERATPYEVLSRFSEQVGETYSGEDIHVRMVRLLAEGTGAASAGVWLKVGDEYRPVATWPTNGSPASVRATKGEPPEFEEATASVPVKHRGELLGMLTVDKPPNEPLTPVEQTLVTDLAGQAALLLANSRLFEDLRASRQRLVAAQDEERRRLERNLHDGAQQQLVALAVQARMAESFAGTDLNRQRELLRQMQEGIQDTLDDLRDLARGIYPPLLADKGLAAALEAQGRKAALPITIDAGGIGRYPREVEAAVYFCALEALQNVAKYARATSAEIRLQDGEGRLAFTVTDDGVGFDVHGAAGSGLTNMRDRLDALGGSLQVRSSLGAGTTISGSIPLAP